jgi:hypothetical protein
MSGSMPNTFASAAVAAGQGLPMIGKLLGHTQVATTARYAHLARDQVKVAAEQVSAVIAQAGGSTKQDSGQRLESRSPPAAGCSMNELTFKDPIVSLAVQSRSSYPRNNRAAQR